MKTPQHLVVMGVSGSGKTTIAAMLAEKLGWEFTEGDDLHPPENIARMSAGIPLDDAARWPWLAAVQQWMSSRAGAGRSTVLTCSALKRAYRDLLAQAEGDVRFVHLLSDVELISERMRRRTGHFMPPSLLPSQVKDLEPLQPGEHGFAVDASASPEEVAAHVLHRLGLAQHP
jgi:gluconokinase